MIVYQTKAPDYEGIIQRAKYYKIKFEFGGGRRTKGGESPNAQITLNLKNLDTKILISRTGKVIVYYPSKTLLDKALKILLRCYVPPICKEHLRCQGPMDPLSKAFILKTTDNWENQGLKLSEAIVEIEEWHDTKTGEYAYFLPDDNGVFIHPNDPNLVYSSRSKIIISAIDKDDKDGKRIVTGERIRWQAMEELRRISKEHRLTPEDLKRAIMRDTKKNK